MTWAAVSGISVGEVHVLEVEFLWHAIQPSHIGGAMEGMANKAEKVLWVTRKSCRSAVSIWHQVDME
jgi:hypothetical protein